MHDKVIVEALSSWRAKGARTPGAQCMHTSAHSACTQCMHTVHTVHAHQGHSACTPGAQCMHTVHTVHSAHSACTQCTQCMHTRGTVHALHRACSTFPARFTLLKCQNTNRSRSIRLAMVSHKPICLTVRLAMNPNMKLATIYTVMHLCSLCIG